jgi:Na+-driven multidrug efflux pump
LRPLPAPLMKHTEFTTRNYASLSVLMLVVGLVVVGFGAVDLAMVAGKGVEHVAAVGTGDVIVTAIMAFFAGGVDVFGSRLAIAEGEGSTARRLPVLVLALVLLLVVWQILGALLVQAVDPALRAVGQKHDIVPLIGDYVSVRTYGVVAAMVYAASSEALKICGMKNLSLVTVCIGFVANAALDWVFLYTGLQRLFSSPETAVATATVGAQVAMGLYAGITFFRAIRARSEHFERPSRVAVGSEFVSMLRTASGVGARHLNDYAGAVVPMLFIGTLGVPSLAAASVATKIYTLFCRVPQACIYGSYVFYGYAVGGRAVDPRTLMRRLFTLEAVPTGVATVLFIATAPWLVRLFGGAQIDASLAELLLLAFLVGMPVYLVEKTFGEMLTVHQRGALLAVGSTVTTYAVAIPVAAVAVFLLKSSFLALLSGSIASAVLGAVFWVVLRRDCWPQVGTDQVAALSGASSRV